MTLIDELRPAWQRRAACRGLGADAAEHNPWFPGKGRSGAAAREICAACPVRVECLAYARAHGVEGIWGGRSFDGRAASTTTARSA